jgi:hypothetical protein
MAAFPEQAAMVPLANNQAISYMIPERAAAPVFPA